MLTMATTAGARSKAQAGKVLAGDQNGAIMVIGIFMACAMIGLMWEFIGLGDAMIWRDRSQEAADAVAFSSAAVQARAMNFIALLNMIMLLMTVLYMAAAFLYNLMDIVLVLTGRSDKGAWVSWNPISQCDEHMIESEVIATVADIFGIPAEPINEIAAYFCDIGGMLEGPHDGLQKFLKGYQKVMVNTMPYMADAQTIIATAAPFAGAVTGSVIGHSYEDYGQARLGTALSGTMLPASVVPNKNKWTYDGKEYDSKDGRIFLPVEEKPMSDLCEKGGDEITSFVKSKLPGFLGTVVGWIVSIISTKMKDAYCKEGATGIFPSLMENGIYWAFAGSGPKADHSPYDFPNSSKGEFWEKSGGPKHVVPYAENGNDWMQVYGLVLGTNAPENSQKKVATNGFNWATAAIPQAGFAVYVAQAEFYFDCDKKWEEPTCNYKELAMYELSWRARMRRVHALNWATDLFGYYSGTAFGDGFGKMIQNVVKDSTIFTDVVGVIKPMFGSMGEKYGDLAVDKGIEAGWKKLKSAGDGAAKGMLNIDTLMPEIIH